VKLYPARSWRWWQVGYKQIMYQLVPLASQYDKIYINNTYEPALPRFLFWTAYPPHEYLRNFKTDQSVPNVVDGFDGFVFADKYYFGSFNDQARTQGLANYLQPGNLYILSQRDDVGPGVDWRSSPPQGIEVKGVSTNSYNEPILYLVEKHDQ